MTATRRLVALFFMLLAARAMADAAVPAVCQVTVHAPSDMAIEVRSFDELVAFHLSHAPTDFVAAAEEAARGAEARLEKGESLGFGEIFYGEMLEALKRRCGEYWEGERADLETSMAIEAWASWLVRAAGLRELPDDALGAVLPEAYSSNLTARANALFLAGACSPAEQPLVQAQMRLLGVGCLRG